jgi:arginine/lysine/ornithine decarboxylase
MTIGTAAELPAETADPAGAVGRISAAFVSVYPPGQPILVPGERITEAKVKEIEALLLAGAAVQGML